jgi:hypothetical protein
VESMFQGKLSGWNCVWVGRGFILIWSFLSFSGGNMGVGKRLPFFWTTFDSDAYYV